MSPCPPLRCSALLLVCLRRSLHCICRALCSCAGVPLSHRLLLSMCRIGLTAESERENQRTPSPRAHSVLAAQPAAQPTHPRSALPDPGPCSRPVAWLCWLTASPQPGLASSSVPPNRSCVRAERLEPCHSASKSAASDRHRPPATRTKHTAAESDRRTAQPHPPLPLSHRPLSLQITLSVDRAHAAWPPQRPTPLPMCRPLLRMRRLPSPSTLRL